MVMSNASPYGPSPVGGPATPQAPITPGNVGGQAAVPFRRATIGRNQILGTEVYTVGGATAILTNAIPTVQGSGFFEKLEMDFNQVTSANAAATAFTEDAPWNTGLNIILGDVNAPLIYNVNGYYTWLANYFGGFWNFDPRTSWDPVVWNLVTGTGGTGGSFRFRLLLSLVAGQRDLIGLTGNQDAGQKFDLSYQVNNGASIYSVGPTNPGTLTVTRTYWSRVVPNAVNNRGLPNIQVPNTWGVLHYTLQARSEAAPVGGGQTPHYVRRLGTTMRAMILVFRSNGSRATAEANAPTQISFYAGDQPIFREDYSTRRNEMFRHYQTSAGVVINTGSVGASNSPMSTAGGFNGVLCYDRISDFDSRAGEETGNDYLWAEQLNQMRFDVTYPTAFGSTNNTLDIVTLDFAVPADKVDSLYAPI